MEKNTQKLWNRLWDKTITPDEFIRMINHQQQSIAWGRMQQIIQKHYPDINSLNVVELGSGLGINAALFAKAGANITLLDYSNQALNQAKYLYGQLDIKAHFIGADIFDLPPTLLNQFDISLSFGLAEHFAGQKRHQTFKTHLNTLKPGGLTFISVPNAHNLPYRIFKSLSQFTPHWKVGEEHPFTRDELISLCHQLDIQEYSIFGDSFLWSLNFINPFTYAAKLKPQWKTLSKLQLSSNHPTPLDSHYSYALILWAMKPK